MVGCLMLVKSMVQNMLSYKISIYSWSVSLLRIIEKACRNFIWFGNIHNRTLFMVAWKKTCQLVLNGELGIRSLVRLNEAFNLKLSWDLLNNNESCAILLRNRIFKGVGLIRYHIFSTLWTDIIAEYSDMWNNSSWSIGSGR